MAYTRFNYRTRKALKIALEAGQQPEVYQEGSFGPDVKDGGSVLRRSSLP